LNHGRLRRISEAQDTNGNSRPSSPTAELLTPLVEKKQAAALTGSGAKVGLVDSRLRERVAARNEKYRSKTPVTSPLPQQQLGFGGISRGRTPKKSTSRSTTPSSNTSSPKLKAESKQTQIEPLQPSPVRSSKPSPRGLKKPESRSRSRKPSANSSTASLAESTLSGGALESRSKNAAPIPTKVKEPSAAQSSAASTANPVGLKASAAPSNGQVALRLAEKAAVDVAADQETF